MTIDPVLATLYAAGLGVAGAIAGVLLGFFAEPVKAYVENRNKLKLLRRSLYGEMGYNYLMLKTMFNDDDSKKSFASIKLAISLLSFEGYHYGKENPLLFYQLKETPMINALYSILISFSATEDVDYCALYAEAIEKRLKAGKSSGSDLDGRLMTKIYKEDLTEIAKQVPIPTSSS